VTSWSRGRRRRGLSGHSFRYVPAHLLAGEPHVIVDGAARPGTVYTLSHWPGTPTPPSLNADLSAEIVRLALAAGETLPAVDVASIDHYDVDGVVALALLVIEGLDAEHGPILVEAARVGDFDVVTDRRAALIAFALNAIDDHEKARPRDTFEYGGVVAGKALDVLSALAADPQRFESLWRAECAAYDASVRALAEGAATIEEIPELDLAVVTVAPRHHGAPSWGSWPIHRAAVHSETDCLRVATLAGGRMEFRYRYESWVRLATRRPRPRVDLDQLARDLTAAEAASARWTFDGAGSITGSLHLIGDDTTTTLEPRRIVDMISGALAALDRGPPAWDPYGGGRSGDR